MTVDINLQIISLMNLTFLKKIWLDLLDCYFNFEMWLKRSSIKSVSSVVFVSCGCFAKDPGEVACLFSTG